MILFLVILTIQITGQTHNNIDSLLIELKESSNKDKFSILLKISNNYSESESDLALQYATDALKLARIESDIIKTGKAFSTISSIYLSLHDFNNSLKYIDSAIYLSEISDNKVLMAKYINKKGIIYYKQSDFQEALLCFNSAVKSTDSMFVAQCYSNIGLVYLELEEIDTALYYFNRALEINTETLDQHGIIGSLINIGHVQIIQGDFDEALTTIEKARLLCIKTEDAFFMTKCLLTEVEIYKELGDIEKAITIGKEALRISSEIDALSVAVNANLALSELYESENDYGRIAWYLLFTCYF